MQGLSGSKGMNQMTPLISEKNKSLRIKRKITDYGAAQTMERKYMDQKSLYSIHEKSTTRGRSKMDKDHSEILSRHQKVQENASYQKKVNAEEL